MANAVPLHAHCYVCAKPVNIGETLCSDECKQKYANMLKRKRTMMYLIYGVLAALIAVIVITGY